MWGLRFGILELGVEVCVLGFRVEGLLLVFSVQVPRFCI